MDIKELLDDDAFDPKKLFDENEYSTLIIKRDGFSKKENNSADLIESLLDKEISRPEAEEIFLKLKHNNSQNLLVDAISKAQRLNEKITLTATCWETGLDFSAHYLFFTELACNSNFQLAMEALTVVIENCEEPVTNEVLSKALKMAEDNSETDKNLKADLINHIRSRLTDNEQ